MDKLLGAHSVMRANPPVSHHAQDTFCGSLRQMCLVRAAGPKLVCTIKLARKAREQSQVASKLR